MRPRARPWRPWPSPPRSDPVTPAELDRRKVVIELTPEGRAVVEETVRRRDAWLESVLTELTPRQRKTLAAAAAIMREAAAR